MDKGEFERRLVNEVKGLPVSRGSQPADVLPKAVRGYDVQTRAQEEVTFGATTDNGHTVALGWMSRHWESDLHTAMKNYERQRSEFTYHVRLDVDSTRLLDLESHDWRRRDWLGRPKRGLFSELAELYWSLHGHFGIRRKQSEQRDERARTREQKERSPKQAEGDERARKLRDWF